MLSFVPAFVLASQVGQLPATDCPVAGHDANQSGPQYFYKGVVYFVCCDGCGPHLVAEPDNFLKEPDPKALIGYSAFDVVAKERIDPKKAAAYSDYKSVRYFFLSEENKAIFDKDPKKAHAAPDKESPEVCAVTREPINLKKTTKYADYNGVRYYFCRAECSSKFSIAPTAYAAKVKPQKAAVHVLQHT